MIFLLSCLSAPADEGDPRFTELLLWTQLAMAEWHIPGVAIAVVEDGKLRHLAGLGARTFGEPEGVTPNTIFRVGSISKVVTGSLAAQLAADGLLDLDAPAADVLGDLRLASGSFADFNAEQLASHTSGLQTLGVPSACDTDPAHLGAALAELSPAWALWSEPGQIYNYSNQGFGFLGLANERASGQRFVDLAQAIFDATGMSTATYDWQVADASEHATGHTMDVATGWPLQLRSLDERACVATFPSGGLMASAADLGHLAESLLAQGAPWMTAEGWKLFTTRGYARTVSSGYGFGLGGSEYRGFASYTHDGSVGGYLSMIWVVPSERLGVVVLLNADHWVADPPAPWGKPTHRIMERALDIYLGLAPTERATSILPSSQWPTLVGAWHSDFDLGDVAISLDGEQLSYSVPSLAVNAPLVPYSGTSFQYPVAQTDGRMEWTGVSFVTDDEGESLLVTGEGVARRVEE